MDFPQYRKYNNGSSFFKILSSKKFIEIQRIGNSSHQFEVEATQYPEMLRIEDMLTCKDGNWLVATEEEFENVMDQ
jgi:hypothetical protein